MNFATDITMNVKLLKLEICTYMLNIWKLKNKNKVKTK